MRNRLLIGLALSLVGLAGCASSHMSRVAEADKNGAAANYPTMRSASPFLAAYLAAIGEPPFEVRSGTDPLAVRLLVLVDEPRYLVFRLEGVGDSAIATFEPAGRRRRSWPIGSDAWRAFQSAVDSLNAWNAPWASTLSTDGVLYGLELRQGARHRALHLANPQKQPENAGFEVFREALMAAMGFEIVTQ